MLDVLNSDECSKYLKALADPDRLRIVECLLGGPKAVGEIVRQIDAPLGNTSHHLKLLRRAGLVSTEKRGRFVFYRLAERYARVRSKASPAALEFGCCRIELPKT